MLATGGSGAADARAGGGEGVGEAWQDWDARALAELDVPVIQAVCATALARGLGRRPPPGLAPLDAATQVAIPEFDGRLLAGVISFKERDRSGSRSARRSRATSPTPSAAARVARLAVRSARLRRGAGRAPAGRRAADELPDQARARRHGGRARHAGQRAALLDALRADGMRVERAVRRRRRADARADRRRRPRPRVPHRRPARGLAAAAAGRRLPATGTRRCPRALREAMEERWGPPPGDRFVDGDDFVIAGLELGNVLVAIQPPRGYGEDPVGIYHDPELPPTHHYLACYRWLDRGLGRRRDRPPRQARHAGVAARQDARAVGRLRARRRARRHPARLPVRRQRPGRGRAGQAPRARRDRRPPGAADDARRHLRRDGRARGAARRVRAPGGARPAQAAGAGRAHLARDRGRQPAVRPRRRASAPTTSATLVEHIDGYLCEVKDIQIKDGLHVLGQRAGGRPAARARGGDAAARLGRRARPAARGRRGVRARRAGAGGRRGRAGAAARPPTCWSASAGPAASAGDLVDRLEAAQMALLDGARRRAAGTRTRAGAVCADVLGRATTASSARCASPPARSSRASAHAPASSTRVMAALCAARLVPAGPSGSPTRGRVDVLPTGRNFYSVDPRALPSELSWEVGQRLADALLDRHRDETGELPRMVGLVAWGTSAMRTQGDDVAEILALLGVRPDVASRVAARHRHRGDPARRARPPAHRRDGAHLGLLPRRLPAPRRAARRRRRDGRRRSTSRPRSTTSPRTRATTPSGWRPSSARGAWRHATTRVFGSQARAPTARACCSCSTRATGATTPTSRRSTRPGAATPTAAASTARRPRDAMRDCLRAASRSRSRTSTRASTTSSTPTTTTSTTAAWSRPCARSAGASRAAYLGDSSRPLARRRAHAGRGDAAGLPRARRQPALDRLDDPPRLQGRGRAVGDRRLPVRLRRDRPASPRTGCTSRWPQRYLLDADVAEFMAPLQPVGGARDRRAPAGGGRPRPVGRARGRHARRPSATASSRSRASSRRPAREPPRSR